MALNLDQQLLLLPITRPMEETRILARSRGQYALTMESQATQLRSAIKFMDIHQGTNQKAELQPIKSLPLAWGIKAMHYCLSPVSSVNSCSHSSFLNSQMSNEASTSNHQAATFIAHSPNFSGILHHSQILHNPKHTVFSTQIVNKDAYSNGIWVINTGATDHMIHSTKLFTKITSTIHTSVELPNGESVLVTHIGIVKIFESLILVDVLCVPSFSFNLISVSKLTSSLKCYIFFLSNLCFI